MAFAITNGNFGSASTWDTGIVPTGSENAYANGFTIQVNGTQSCGAVRNDASDYYLPNTAIPIMTSSTSPSGIVSASSQVAGYEGWRAFDRNTTTVWQTAGGVTSAILTYQFPISKIIKRYSFKNFGATTGARNFTFEGSNDGSSWTTLDTQTSINVGANGIFTSGLLANTTAYLYYRINVTTVNGGTAIQMTEFEMTESISTSVGQIVGGTFNLLNGSSLEATATSGSGGIYLGATTTAVVTYNLTTGNSATIKASCISIPSAAGYKAILHSNTGTLNCVGNYNVDGLNVNGKCIIQSTAAGVLNILGNVTNTMTAGGNANATIISSGGATINITAPVFSGGGALNNTFINALLVSNGGNVTLTGNPVANINPAINITGGSLTIIGNPQGSSTAPAVLNISSACTINVVGTPIAGSGANAIVGLGLVRITGNPINTNRFMVIYAPQVTIDATTNSWTFQQFAGADITLYASGASLGNPVQADVRFGTTYGATNEFTGTLRVPNPNTVLLGNLTDNTTGTYLPSSPADFVSELNTSTASVAVRLRNCATVATTGDQIASYGV